MFFFTRRKNIYNLFAVFFALGMLFMGISYMKESAMELVKLVDPATYAGYGTLVFVLFGFVLTTIIQSSSATVAITLTALYAGALQFDAAAAVVIGSEIGTTIKILLWGVTGSADKKRVAYGNFFYNIFTSVLAFVCLRWLIYFITSVVGIKDALIGLVFFQTTINTLSIIIFVPFLNIFSGWLERRFSPNDGDDNSYISHNLPALPVLAPDALRHEVTTLLSKVLNYCTDILNTHTVHTKGLLQNIKSFAHTTKNIEEEYHKLKQTEGDILAYFSMLQNNQTLTTDTEQMLRYLHAARQAIYAAKAVKDIAHNLAEFDASGGESRLILSREQVAELVRVFIPAGSNESRLMDMVETQLNKVIELGFVRRLKPVGEGSKKGAQVPMYEVRRILKAYVDAQWLADFDQRLADYQAHLAAPQGEADDE